MADNNMDREIMRIADNLNIVIPEAITSQFVIDIMRRMMDKVISLEERITNLEVKKCNYVVSVGVSELVCVSNCRILYFCDVFCLSI